MTIIFYEYEYCKNLLENKVDKITQRDLNFLAKYWEYEGLKESVIKEKLIEWATKNDEMFNVIRSRTKLRRALNHKRTYKLRFPKTVDVYQSELDAIKTVNDKDLEKILFVMLVCAKYFKNNSSRKEVREYQQAENLYSNQNIKDMILLSGTKISVKKWNEYKHKTTVMGLTSPTFLDSSFLVLGFENKNFYAEPVLKIEDWRNIVAYLQEFNGETIINCSECGMKIRKKKGNRHIMCSDCYKKSINISKLNYKKNILANIRN